MPIEHIEKIKREFQANLEKNSSKYRRAIIRQLDYLYRKGNTQDLQSFLESVQKYFDIPATEKALVLKALTDAEAQITTLWDDYFAESVDLFDPIEPNIFEKIQALYKVDFSQIKSDARDVITNEIRRTVRAGKGYEVLRSRLLQKSLGEAQSRTLAITALAQFDNGMMFEYAQQGGVQKFKYDGVLHPNTRAFCRAHLGKQYTLEQIRKMDNGQGLPVETSCGGYNCTHFWTPVIAEATSKKRPKKKVDSATATGVPVSEALDVTVRGDHKRAIDYAIRLIDQVHGDGVLKTLPVVNLVNGTDEGRFSYYVGSREAVQIAVRESGAHRELTTIHEIGHYLDHSGIGKRLEMSSVSDTMMDGWRKAVRSSAAYEKLISAKRRGYVEVERGGIKGIFTGPSFHSHWNYLLSDEELWARSYAQYITTRTNDAVLRDQLAIALSNKVEDGNQWTDDDFEPIAKEIDNLFKQLGWMK